jgi:hypothetical protein
MNTTRTNYELRLSARILLEWRTPPGNPDYQAVLTDLLETHAGAALHGLSKRQEIISLDEDGSLLWFLSETLQDDQTKWLGELSSKLDDNGELAFRCFRTFRAAAIGLNDDS